MLIAHHRQGERQQRADYRGQHRRQIAQRHDFHSDTLPRHILQNNYNIFKYISMH